MELRDDTNNSIDSYSLLLVKNNLFVLPTINQLITCRMDWNLVAQVAGHVTNSCGHVMRAVCGSRAWSRLSYVSQREN